MPTILTKKSDTPGSIPATANLTNAAGGAELAVNTADKRLFTITSGSQVVELGTNPSSLTCADGSFTLLKAASASITNLTATSLVLSNLSIASANVTTLTSASATITNLLATSLTVSGNTFLATSSGNVGIGTSSPDAKLKLVGSSISSPLLALRDDGTPAANMILASSNALGTMMVLNSSGNLGVGTGSVTAGFRGQFEGDSAANHISIGVRNTNTTGFSRVVLGNNVGQARFTIGYTGSTASAPFGASLGYLGTEGNEPFLFQTNGAEKMRLDSSGNLGIGTSSPATKLQVNGGYISQSDGTVTTYMGSDGTGSLFGTVTNQYLRFVTNNTERMRLDTSGNLGLGVTPSAWVSTSKGFQIGSNGWASLSQQHTGATNLMSNAYESSASTFKYIASAYAGRYNINLNDGVHSWYTAPSGTAGNTITFTQAMTLDASGNLLVGSTSSSAVANKNVDVNGTGDAAFTVRVGGTTYAYLYATASTALVGSPANIPFLFYTNGTERGRFSAGGNFGVNTNNPQQKIHITGNDQSNVRMRWENTGTGGRNYEIVGGLNGGNNSSFSVYDATAAANRLEITDTGTFIVPAVYNDTTANAANVQVDSAGVLRRSTSSLRYKTDVQDATHGLAEVLALRPVTYKGKTDGDKVFGGLIAEEVHDAGLTEFVVYDNDGQPDALAYGNMVSVLVKAIQEQQAMIKSLEAKVAALEAK